MINLRLSLRRYSMFPYPLHESSKEAVQSIKDFPLQFYSQIPELLLIAAKKNPKVVLHGSFKKGIVKAYETFLTLFANRDFDSLDGLVEYNIIRRLKLLDEKYQQLGYTYKIVGDITDAQLFMLSPFIVLGSMLPYRNLNFPSEFYEITKIKTPIKIETQTMRYLIKTDVKPAKSFKEFKDLNLKELNQSENLAPYKERIMSLQALMNKQSLVYIIEDYGIYTSFKLNVYNPNGVLVDGWDSKSRMEYHLIRMENTNLMGGGFSRFLFWGSGYYPFMTKQLEEVLNQWTITDIDCFMHGNSIIG